MKKTLLYLFPVFLIFIALSNCSKPSSTDTDTNSENITCESSDYNDKFKQINGTLSYNKIKDLFGVEGDNYRNDYNGTDIIKFYKWYPCPGKKTSYVECWLRNDKLMLAAKTIKDNSCSTNISNQSFSSILNGMSYSEVKAVLKSDGDNFRNDYDYPDTTEKIKFYRFYDCNDKSKYIEVWFYTGIGANLITKNF